MSSASFTMFNQDPVQFGGQDGYYTDVATGEVQLTHRYYDAATGHFLNRDPIGYSGGQNLYAYCGNNPIMNSDPDGDRPLNSSDFRHLHHLYDYIGHYDALDVSDRPNRSLQIQEVNKAVADVKAYIGKLPAGSADPVNLKALYWAIEQLGKNWGVGHSAVLPGYATGSGPIQCNYFVASAYMLGAGVKNWPSNGYSFRQLAPTAETANGFAAKKHVDYTKIEFSISPGDIVAFHAIGDSGHSTLSIGGGLLIYAGGIGIGKMGSYDYVMHNGDNPHDYSTDRRYVP